MNQFILQCEVGKENQILPYCDAIILGGNASFSTSFLNAFTAYSNHFKGLSAGFVDLPADFEHQVMLIRHCIQRGSKVILLGATWQHYQKLASSLTSVHVLSNRIEEYEAAVTTHFLGFQRHLVSTEKIYEIEQHSSDSASLGLLTEDFSNAEACLRTSNTLFIDASVCKAAHVPGYGGCEPSGLEPEQLIQLVRYASHSPHLSMIGFGIDNNHFDAQNCGSLMKIYATCIWYVLEGLNHGSYTAQSATETTFVNLQDYDEILEFAFDGQADKWWVRIQQDQESSFIACTANDHEEAVKGSLTPRLHRYLFEMR